MTIQARAGRIKLVLFDVDGVLTDGKVMLHADGTESKRFDIKDGLAIVWAQRAGLTVGFLSARNSPTTVHRAAQLGVTLVHQGVPSKLEAFEQIIAERGEADAEVAYMGDDIVDLPVLARAGFSAAPADASSDVRSRVHWVSSAKAGDGAVRELIELILRARGQWESIVTAYLAEARHPAGTRNDPQTATGPGAPTSRLVVSSGRRSPGTATTEGQESRREK